MPEDIESLWKVPLDNSSKYLQEKNRKMNMKRGRKSRSDQQDGKKVKQ